MEMQSVWQAKAPMLEKNKQSFILEKRLNLPKIV
jgi:hypothetical protein